MTVSKVLKVMCHEYANLYIYSVTFGFSNKILKVSITCFVHLFLVAQSEAPPPDLEGH